MVSFSCNQPIQTLTIHAHHILNDKPQNQVKEFHQTIEEEKEVAPKRHATKRWG